MVCALLLLAQCCKGAESGSAVSKNERFKVEAVALLPGSHGPYAFRYTWSERGPGGKFAATTSFEVTYDSTAHFRMRLFVSPTGNGFLVQTSVSKPELIFHSRSGEKLYSLDASATVNSDERLTEDGACLRLIDPKTRYTAEPVVIGRIFLPWGCETAGMAELLKPPKSIDVQPFLLKLEDDDPAVREKAAEAIRALGSTAAETLEREIGRARSDEPRARMEEILAKIRLDARGHAHPHRNLLLLAGALSHPDGAIAAAARERLRAILPKEGKPEAAWVEEHVDRLRWDEERQTYR